MASGIKTFLSEIGKDAKAVFGWLGSTGGQNEIKEAEGAAEVVTTSINAPAGLALTGVVNLINAGMTQVITAETVAAAAGQSAGTGVQKAAAVESALAPQISSLLESMGVKSPTATQIQNVATALSRGLTGIVNSLPPVSSTPAPATATPATT